MKFNKLKTKLTCIFLLDAFSIIKVGLLDYSIEKLKDWASAPLSHRLKDYWNFPVTSVRLVIYKEIKQQSEE
ncbi:hypothetical protein NAT51_16100 [Flavobacterium amniphilum]|uniref:hypothetical protein n=1 Tax=Flavobacterium amniphilum TaxID=1834035 RepID=UPI002029DAD9|nr:hypothetical protein [Flavobacterium amniphilum]MCL9807058.1 hypothetical protein [Flavobacterium amniphilum]